MTEEKISRPGGRSARVQQAVHRAVREIQDEAGRDGLTIVAIAARAGVTPSTIYRRWGELPQLLSDVAIENLRPELLPPDTGSFRGDMETWLEQYLEEISSPFGRSMLCDVLSSPEPVNAGQCTRYLIEQFEIMRLRAQDRGESPPTSESILDCIIAPLVFRILFAAEVPELSYARKLIARTRL
ncbi:TetR family transcriptional regulator [[Pantoea] beijingensis]|uniref:TetR family transcriptional regulator n=1 Tax=[Pantoea] beijingensis TaxID=1324864 RepID=A0A443IFS0_9GAMM|nr:TetR/AcrR family transcriptional regulator [[Pantoea] beijingensis]RWR02927.1 TetR family transcriptional regulator [[Pantoea] beijingensis]